MDEMFKDIFMTSNENYINEIKKIVNDYQHGYYYIIKYKKSYLYNYIEEWCTGHKLNTFAEKIYWVINKLEDFPICEHPMCKNKLTSKQFEHLTTGYRRHCSKKCANNNPLSKQRVREYNMKKYGYEHTAQVPSIKNKMAETNRKLYGTENVFASNYGKMKIKKYWNDNFGVDNPLQIQRIKDLQASHREQSKLKEYESKKKNKSFNTSKPEEECYKLLCEKFGKEDVERQYNKDSRYPFLCDFYIKSKDMFIEYNGIWTHGKHPYNPNSEEDNKILEIWKEKSKTKKFYHVAINVWTVYDPNKRNKAIESGINIIELWSMKDVNNFLNSL